MNLNKLFLRWIAVFGILTILSVNGWGAIAYRSATSARATTGNLTINKPVGVVSGDVMIASIAIRPDTATVTPPTGWTVVRTTIYSGTNKLIVYYKVAGGSEGASYTWTMGSSPAYSVGGILAFSGVDTSSPIVAENGQTDTDEFSSTPSINVTASNTMLVTSHEHHSAYSWTPPTGMTEAVDVRSPTTSGGVGIDLEINYVTQAAAGLTGAKTATAGDDDNGAAHILALRPLVTSATASDDSYTNFIGAQLIIGGTDGVLNNDGGPGISVTNFDATTTQGGSVTVSADGNFTYTPPTGFIGTDTFTYTITDSNSITDTATVTIVTDTQYSGFHIFERINPDSTKNIRGNYAIAGNTVMCLTERTDSYGGTCHGQTDYAELTSNLRISKYIDIDGDGSTWNSTSSYINLPATYDNRVGRGVLWAGLFWQGRISTDTEHPLRYGVENGSSYDLIETGEGSGFGTLDITTTGANTIKLKVDNGSYSNAQASTFYTEDTSGGTTYAAFADVTSILQASNLNDGKHVFTVANLTTNEGREDNPGVFGGWSLVVIYAEDVYGKTRNISVYSGFDSIDTSNDPFTITDFKLPTSNTVHATLSLFSGEGEYLYGWRPTDTSDDDWVKISNDGVNYEYMPGATTDRNIFDAVFNGILRDDVTGHSNNLQVNNDGVDIDSFDVSALVTTYRDNDPTMNTMYIKWYSDEDYITPSMITFATELYEPKLCYDYSFKQDGVYLKADNDGYQLPMLTGTINNSQIDVSVYIRNIESDIDAANISFYTSDVNSTLFNYADNSIASSNVNGSILIPRDDSGVGCGYHDAATTPIGCVSGSNVRIGLGEGATGYSINGAGNFGSTDFAYAKFGLKPKFNGLKDVNESLGLSVDYTIRPDGVSSDIEYNYMLGVNMDMCPASAGYTPTWGTFNVVDRYATAIGDLPANNLRTQVSRKAFDVDVAAYGKAADNTYTIKPIADINTTVLVEMIDNDAFHDANASCANPDSNVSQAIYVPLTITSGAGGDMTDPVPTQLLPYYNFAVKNAAFRIWYFNDKDDLLIQNWTATTSDPTYKLNLQSINGLYKSDTHTLCVSDCGDPTSKDCFDCIRANYAKPLCSRDNFAVRPESYDLRIYDVNQSLVQTDPLKNATKIDLSTQYQYTPQFGASIGRINLAAGYNYRYDMNATGNDTNLAKVPGYTRYFNGANADYNATMIWDPEVGHVTTGCNDTTGKNLSFYVANGQMTNNEQNQTQVGEYRLNIIDPGWTGVDWKPALMTHHTSGFQSGLDCDGTSTSTDTSPVGCITSSAHVGGGYTYKDHDLRLKPAKFDLSSIVYGFGKTPFVIGAGGNGYVYNSNLGVDNDMAMAVHSYGPIKAVGYGGETLSNFVKECYATDLNVSISHDANASLYFVGRMSVAEINGTQIYDSLKFDVDGTLVRTIEDTYFGKTGNGQTVPTIHLNFDRNATTPVNPEYVQYGDLNVSCLVASDCNMSAAFNTTPNTAFGSDEMDFNITHVYGRVVARKVTVMGLIAFDALAKYEIYNLNHLMATTLAADQFDSDWFVNTLHTDPNYGDANVTVIDPAAGSNLPTHSNSINGVETYAFDPFTIRQGYKAHIDTEGWLWYGGINALTYSDPNGPAQAGADNLSCLTHPCFDISMGRIIGNTGSAKTESEAQKANKSTSSGTGWNTTREYAPAAR